ncbi:hypothetical protein J2T32_003391 [Kerstersia gyiorum]|nr:hypothetical protein [Kerstersia gyiorum]MCP1638263.1 hypothetical protein [Kerstersia gyiorum]MCP1672860.1 hypothetical protein [Kerstersia gyiorum]MCP1680676.1 hypothetical protein [Kerstersia gyiorum]MCP1684051.1 hypothetical protein [Kerstersia gyiorum]
MSHLVELVLRCGVEAYSEAVRVVRDLPFVT